MVRARSNDSANRAWSSSRRIRTLLRDEAGCVVIAQDLREMDRAADDEGGAVVPAVVELDRAAAALHQPAGDVQAEPVALRALAAGAALEHRGPQVVGHAGA